MPECDCTISEKIFVTNPNTGSTGSLTIQDFTITP